MSLHLVANNDRKFARGVRAKSKDSRGPVRSAKKVAEKTDDPWVEWIE